VTKITYTCKVCSISTEQEEDEFWSEDQYDPEDPGQIDLEAMGLGDVLRKTNREMICGSCSDELERRFSRPARTSGGRTLGDEIIAAHRIALKALAELLDRRQDRVVDEVFPGLGAQITRPADARSVRAQAELCRALDRVGHPVAITIPEWVGEESGEGPFLFAEAGENGAVRGLLATDWHCVFGRGCVNGYAYAPDGSPA
jgi:hypothetical protein